MIHIKCQDLFSVEKKKNASAEVMVGALRTNLEPLGLTSCSKLMMSYH